MAEHAYTSSSTRPPLTIITSRRIAVVTALLAVSGASAAKAPPDIRASDIRPDHPDAELLSLAPRLRTILAETSATEISDGVTVPPNAHDADHESWVDRVGTDLEEICQEIVDAPRPQTDAGRALKAAAAMHQLRFAYHGGWPGAGEALAWDVLSEIAGDTYVPVTLPDYAREHSEPGRA